MKNIKGKEDKKDKEEKYMRKRRRQIEKCRRNGGMTRR
jgi:hypothetical protein